MKIDLCKIFGVEEGEEFNIVYKDDVMDVCTFKIVNGYLYDTIGNEYCSSPMGINILAKIKNIIKLPKKKQFTDDELCILRNVDKKYKWIARDDDGQLSAFVYKPYKDTFMWRLSEASYEDITVFNYLFQSVQWEDEEPVFIDDYVERNV